MLQQGKCRKFVSESFSLVITLRMSMQKFACFHFEVKSENKEEVKLFGSFLISASK